MSVRPTQTKSGYPRRSRQPYPTGGEDPGAQEPGAQHPAGADPSVEPPVAEPLEGPVGTGSVPGAPEPAPGPAPGPTPGAGSRVVDRRAQRAARRTRRTVAIVCGVVVAVCLVLTILIVNMARTRTSAPGAETNPVASSIGPPGPVAVPSLITYHPNPGALAPEGDNP